MSQVYFHQKDKFLQYTDESHRTRANQAKMVGIVLIKPSSYKMLFYDWLIS